MARNVTIASIPAKPLVVTEKGNWDKCIQEEIHYWQTQLEQVVYDTPDLIVTPECCDRPQGLTSSEKIEYYRARGHQIRDFFIEAAKKYHTNIAYGAVRNMEDGTFRNSIQFIGREGNVNGIYNKHLLVIEEYTKTDILYGRDIKAVKTDIGKVCGAICFDLNFDEVLKKTAAAKPELLVFSSAYHGGIMQPHWAYQCRSYFISAISGTQTANIINPVGEIISESSNYYPYLVSKINLDYEVVHLDYNWEKLRAMKEKYGGGVEMRTPYGLGCVLLSCLRDDRTMAQIVDEFEIERWNEYYKRALAARDLPGRVEL